MSKQLSAILQGLKAKRRSIQVTVDIYGLLIPGTNRRAVDRLDDAPTKNPRTAKRVPQISASPAQPATAIRR